MAVYEQPGRTQSTDKSGKKTLTITYVGNSVASAPIISGATLVSQSVVSAEAGLINSSFQYDMTTASASTTGSGGAFSSTGIEFVGSLRTVPIEAHPNFAEPYLYPKDKKFIKDKTSELVSINAMPDLSSCTDPERAASLFGYLVNGVESYYVPSIILRKTYNSSSIPSGNKLGKIADPNVYYSAKPTDATWLLINLSARGQSGSYVITEEYELSGEGGWDTYLYEA